MARYAVRFGDFFDYNDGNKAMEVIIMAKVALVTGASSGIGRMVAQELKSAGFKVYAAARRVDRMADLEKNGITPVALWPKSKGFQQKSGTWQWPRKFSPAISPLTNPANAEIS